jgi:quinol monooxygenase YgiN
MAPMASLDEHAVLDVQLSWKATGAKLLFTPGEAARLRGPRMKRPDREGGTSMRQMRGIVLVVGALFGWIAGMQILAQKVGAQQVPLQTPSNPSPLYVVTFVDVTPDNKDVGAAALKQYVLTTRKEAGNQRVDLIVQLNRVNHFVLYEVWQNEDAFRKHEAAQATKDFRAKMQPLIGAPFDQRLHFKIE